MYLCRGVTTHTLTPHMSRRGTHIYPAHGSAGDSYLRTDIWGVRTHIWGLLLIWKLISEDSYLRTDIWGLICGNSYLGTHTYLLISGQSELIALISEDSCLRTDDIWGLISGHSFLRTHIWGLISGDSYLKTYTWGLISVIRTHNWWLSWSLPYWRPAWSVILITGHWPHRMVLINYTGLISTHNWRLAWSVLATEELAWPRNS